MKSQVLAGLVGARELAIVFVFLHDGREFEVVTRSRFNVDPEGAVWSNAIEVAAAPPREPACFRRVSLRAPVFDTRAPEELRGAELEAWFVRAEQGHFPRNWQEVAFHDYGDTALPPGARLRFEPGQVRVPIII